MYEGFGDLQDEEHVPGSQCSMLQDYQWHPDHGLVGSIEIMVKLELIGITGY